MIDDLGRVLTDRAGGLRPEPAAQSQPEALIPRAGDWIVFEDPGYVRFTYGRALVEKATAKQVVVTKNTRWTKRLPRSVIVAVLADEEEAKRLIQSLDGAAGEFRRRQRSAEDERSRRISEADGAARRQIGRIIASAMSARQGQDPQGLGAEPASAVPQADAR